MVNYKNMHIIVVSLHTHSIEATVGFENTVYSLRSGQSVSVCVIVHTPISPRNCPIEFPFDMRFQLVGATSGKFYTNNIVIFICST